MNVIARLEYEVAYYDSAVHRFNHYTTRTPPLRHVQVFSYKISPVCRLRYPCSCSSHFCFLVLFIPLFVFMLSAVINVSLLFLDYISSSWIEVSTQPSKYWWVLFLVFLTHIIHSCNLTDVRLCVLSLFSLSFGPFVWGTPLSVLSMIQRILQEGLTWSLFIWRNFCCRVWFREVFSFVLGNCRITITHTSVKRPTGRQNKAGRSSV